jgi:hypothetical protein
MTTAERARNLAVAAGHFPLLGPVSPEDLLEVVRLELGHPEILDGFRPYGGHFSRVEPLGTILHVVSGNTPHAALQSLLRGLLLGARHLVKVPSEGLPEVEHFLALLPAELRDTVTVSRNLPDAWLREAAVVVVFGSDETVAHFRKRVRPGIVFEPHPHRISLELVFEDAPDEVIAAIAEDVSRFAQKGCLSPHDIYVAGDARSFAARLAEAMQRFEEREPRGPVSTLEAAEIADVRANYRFRAASDPRVALWESADSSAWTVIFEDDPWFAASCLNRVVYVKPLPENLASALEPVLPWLAAVGIWPATPAHAETAATLRPSRICPAGRMQAPPLTWHQEGRQTLAPMARWVDFEPNFG